MLKEVLQAEGLNGNMHQPKEWRTLDMVIMRVNLKYCFLLLIKIPIWNKKNNNYGVYNMHKIKCTRITA